MSGKVKEEVKKYLESKGFTISNGDQRIVNLLGEKIEFKGVVGVVENKVKVYWKWNPEKNRGEISVSIYNTGKRGNEIAEDLESKGFIVEVVDENVYGKVKFKGDGVRKLKETISSIK